MNLSESYKRRLGELAGINVSNEDDSKVLEIRSNLDKLFRYDVFFDRNNKIFKVENQGDTADKMTERPWLDLFLNFAPGKILDYDFLRSTLSKIPELYVSDIL